MIVDVSNFQKLYDVLRKLDLTGDGPPEAPWGGDAPTVDVIRDAIGEAMTALPRVYRSGYAAPLLDSLGTLVPALASDSFALEAITGAVYDHSDTTVRVQLRQFLAVVSNLYRSFLSASKRANADVPLVGQVPPLAMFQHKADFGPFTITSDQMQQAVDSAIGVVSLPSAYRDQPVLWASLAHETGGHDVVHADPDLLPQLRDGVQKLFPGGTVGATGQVSMQRLQGLLWSYWMDEAVADVYGVLNIGPTFGINLAAFFAALNAAFHPSPTPVLRTASGHPPNSNDLDPHPTDILRLDLARGVVDSLTGLSQATRDSYTAALDEVSALCGGDADFIVLQGVVRTENGSGIRLNNRLPMAPMKAAARTVGAFIATARFDALGGKSIQDIETWDNPDELAAQAVRAALTVGTSADEAGDDAQLLAGATLAVLDNPANYTKISAGLARALTASFARDPIWSPPSPDPVRIEIVELDLDAFGPPLAIV